MKRFDLLLIAVVLTTIFISCRGGENKADNDVDTYNKERSAEEKIPDVGSAPPAATKEDSNAVKPGNSEILAKIDQYLVSKPEYKADANGISQATVTVRNTLPNITFQKAIVEVNLLASDGKVLRNDFHPIQNIEPGDVETIKIQGLSNAASMTARIVKIKSDVLTNGETILVGGQPGSGK